MDLSKLSIEDLVALKAGDLSKVSTQGLQTLKSQQFGDRLKQQNPGEYDPNSKEFQDKYGATSGMSNTDKFLAGAGKAFTDIGRGLGQVVGVVSREDVAKSRALDKPLMDTKAGIAGNITGNVAAIAPTMFIPGAGSLAGSALIGATTGAIAPSVSTEETIKNTLLGGALGVGGNVLGRLGGSLYQGGKALFDPFTKSGQERIAARTLQNFASDPARAAAELQNARQLVPGSMPSMAQASGDAGLAQLERTLVNNPESGSRLADLYAAQRAARIGAVENIAGTAAQREAAVQARSAATAPLYEQFTSKAYPIDAQLQEILSRPAIAQASARGAKIAANQGLSNPIASATAPAGPSILGANGLPMSLGSAAQPGTITGKGLQYINQGVGDLLGDATSGIGKAEKAAIMEAKNALTQKVEQINPVYAEANKKFAELSKPINTMDVAQALLDKLEPALARYGASTKEHASAYARALEAAKETVKNQTGINKPIGQVVDEKALEIFNNVAKDAARSVNAAELGRAAGSNTAQNLAAQNLLRRTLGPTGLPQSWAESGPLQAFLTPYTGITRLAGSEQRVLDRLTQAAMDPADAAGLLQMASQPVGLLGTTAPRAIPGLTGAGMLSYGGQQ